MKTIELKIIATVSNDRDHLDDDDWGGVISKITLSEGLPADLLKGLDTFSHVDVMFIFHRLNIDDQQPASRHPRNNPIWPKIGLLSQRSAHHPNPIGLTTAKLLRVKGNEITVQGLDAVNGSPVLDIKPVFREFQATDTHQPNWVSELLKDYYEKS